jgi:8-oxo-dGTP pyrophosphatase MutT (NUDIX family)
MEVLLLKRSPTSGFIPGAWVFPGGTVDQSDSDPNLAKQVHGLTPEGARERLNLKGPALSALAYWIAAIRETFEETGILLCREGPAHASRDAASRTTGPTPDAVGSARSALVSGEAGFLETLQELEVELDAGALAYFGHWLTPSCEPRRYETRFFAAAVCPNAAVTPHKTEMEDALWITPADALARNRQGAFPLVVPTLYTLEELTPFTTPDEALDFLEGRPVPLRLPRPERAEGGVLFRISS